VSWDIAETREFYTLAEVGAILRMDPEHVRRKLIGRKRLRHYRPVKGGRILVRHRDLEAYMERQAVDVAPEKERDGA
jgi:excisionase family DNA binding protein